MLIESMIDSTASPEKRLWPSKTLVVGLGKTGLSVLRYLAGRGCELAVTDSRQVPPGLEDIRVQMPDLGLFLGGFDAAAFAAAEQIIVSPGVCVAGQPLFQQAIARGVPVIGDIELFAREARRPTVAITGSNGKSTVTTLVGEMGRAAGFRPGVGGNLGVPALDLLGHDYDCYVLELSSFQLETTHSLRTAAAVVLNVSPDHLDRYPDYAAYLAAKRRIYQGADTCVVNRDDPAVAAMPAAGSAQVGFTLGGPQEGDFGLRRRGEEFWLCRGSEFLLAAGDLKLRGRHNIANALAALALGEALGFPMAAMLQALRSFGGLEHRMQWVGEFAGVEWFNDSKATNVGAAVAALEGLSAELPRGGTIVLIAGGDGKGADFSALRPVVSRAVRSLVLLGRDAPLIEQALGGVRPVAYAADMNEAVQLAAAAARPGDCVLLSPACASFDMFRNFEERGLAFVSAFRGLVR